MSETSFLADARAVIACEGEALASLGARLDEEHGLFGYRGATLRGMGGVVARHAEELPGARHGRVEPHRGARFEHAELDEIGGVVLLELRDHAGRKAA